ncbi:class II aldolase/adducin family protein [Propionispora hippei]|uniref:L-ribulose-5-phosphate 4-epimerase n=1 Tax=Propionispora hippei DSM 15287 TaxID=1123003 RepID=A0A1M6EMD0_9FIRM|nr:class II aldolase/adducin family protein [Propionispora hippei]SHI86583.1 L-ribulose-5-phosphate 4-epimerase [Propionispora hippei DSM 15287]
MLLENLRKEVLSAALQLIRYGLVTLTGGNVSGRDEQTGYIAITPSGMDYEKLNPADIVIIDGAGNTVDGKWKASVDTKDHLYIYRQRPDIQGIIHTHSPYACSFAMLHREIPCCSTTLANEVGGSVPVARYTPVAEAAIGPAVMEVLGDKNACLLANHGVIAVGHSVRHALVAAVMLEDGAKVYHLASLKGEPVQLPPEEIEKARNVFLYTYGQSS